MKILRNMFSSAPRTLHLVLEDGIKDLRQHRGRGHDLRGALHARATAGDGYGARAPNGNPWPPASIAGPSVRRSAPMRGRRNTSPITTNRGHPAYGRHLHAHMPSADDGAGAREPRRGHLASCIGDRTNTGRGFGGWLPAWRPGEGRTHGHVAHARKAREPRRSAPSRLVPTIGRRCRRTSPATISRGHGCGPRL